MPQKQPSALLQPGAIPDLGSRELQALCTIAEYGSFMAAALTLNISQPALTRTVQRVEASLGVELFRRSTRRVEITPAGQEFIDLANRVLSDLSISYENMRSVAQEQRGRIIVSAAMSAAYTQMPRIVARYRESRPNIEIHLREGVHGAVVDDIRSGVADLGVTYLEFIADDFAVVELGREVFHVVMPKDHPLAGSDGIRIGDLADTPLVSMPKSSHMRKLFDGVASLAGIRFQHAITVHHFATAMACVRASVGITLVPGAAVPAAIGAGLVSRPLVEPKLERPVGVLFLQHRSPTPLVSGFLAHLKEHWGRDAERASSAARKARRQDR